MRFSWTPASAEPVSCSGRVRLVFPRIALLLFFGLVLVFPGLAQAPAADPNAAQLLSSDAQAWLRAANQRRKIS
jgi:hypothetical protein